ncbi:MAG: GAF domain-containing protein [Candidatus Kapaibacterium sp.]|nr:MAG: GAF domain-containing protein [Candidatus Kapabacteria bacterium]
MSTQIVLNDKVSAVVYQNYDEPIDSSTCDNIPIDTPGRIQGYGLLFLVEEPTLMILQTATNTMTHIGMDSRVLLGKTFFSLLSTADGEMLRTILQSTNFDAINPVPLIVEGKRCDAIFHRLNGYLYIELEPASPLQDNAAEYRNLSTQAVMNLSEATTLEELIDVAVKEIRTLTGCDRVKLYKYDERYNGQVIAESRVDGVPSFLGLFFPATDITSPARKMQVLNFTRYIPDIQGDYAMLVPQEHPWTKEPLDLTYAQIRGVNPLHVEYLTNMGVHGSLTFSVVMEGRLWGLFACHHHKPRFVSYTHRLVCEQVGRMFVELLPEVAGTAKFEAELQGRKKHLMTVRETGAALIKNVLQHHAELEKLVGKETAEIRIGSQLASIYDEVNLLYPMDYYVAPKDVNTVQYHLGMHTFRNRHRINGHLNNQNGHELLKTEQELLKMVSADGAVVWRESTNSVQHLGRTPDTEAVRTILDALTNPMSPTMEKGDGNGLFVTNHLVLNFPNAEYLKDTASGMLVIPISRRAGDFLVWFRPEQIVKATWAGYQDKSQSGEEGKVRLTPRTSFEAWKQEIRNTSMAWHPAEVQIATEFRDALLALEDSYFASPASGNLLGAGSTK